jgi:bifunctional non-homologous end joining protein LigD
MEEIAAGKGKKSVWHSNRKANRGTQASRPQSQREFRAELQAQSKALPKSRRKTTREGNGSRGRTSKRKATAKAAIPVATRRSADPLPAKKRRARLPDFVPPSLATLHTAPPEGPDWIHEIKFDGYRIEAQLDHGRVRLLTRKQLDWTHRFERIAEAVAALPAETALLDGELVVENEKGISSFSLLQTDLKEGREDRFVYWVFDLLHLDGRDFTPEPLSVRKAALQRLLKGQSRKSPVRFAEHFEENGSVIFQHARDMDLEGIVSKLRNAPYRSGRSESFIKTKCHNAQEFVVIGFTPSTAMPNAVGALTVAFHENGKLRYAGRVGTGYTHETARDLWKRLNALQADRAPVTLPKDERRKNVTWVKPELVVETEFRGLTHDGLLRQASYKGLREDKPAREVVRETPAAEAAPRQLRRAEARSIVPKLAGAQTRRSKPSGGARGNTSQVEIADVHLTHPDRVYWTDVGVTKQDLANYYVNVWKLMAPHLVDRPLAIVRCPDGITGECFFQKHIASNIKNSPLRRVVKSKEHDVIAVEKLSDLIELAQFGALEIHVRGSRLERLEACDRIVFDLDPGEGVSWKEIVAAAQETRDRLKAQKLKSFVKLSGGKGLHVVVPITGADWDTTKRFAARFAAAMTADSPQRYLTKMTKSLRDRKIFIDYFRNSREATSVAVYSTRARAGAPISMPLSWEALARTTAGNQFTIGNSKRYLSAEPWAEIGKIKQKLPE